MLIVEQHFLEAKFNPENWDTFENFKDAYIDYLRQTIVSELTYIKSDGEREIFDPIIHAEDTITFEIWMEASMSGDHHEELQMIGKVAARNFTEACHKLACKQYLEQVLKNESDTLCAINKVMIGVWGYDPEELSYFGRKWYPTMDMAYRTL